MPSIIFKTTCDHGRWGMIITLRFHNRNMLFFASKLYPKKNREACVKTQVWHEASPRTKTQIWIWNKSNIKSQTTINWNGGSSNLVSTTRITTTKPKIQWKQPQHPALRHVLFINEYELSCRTIKFLSSPTHSYLICPFQWAPSPALLNRFSACGCSL